jgi:hypothetical protein
MGERQEQRECKNKLALRVIEWVNRGHFRHVRKDTGRQESGYAPDEATYHLNAIT